MSFIDDINNFKVEGAKNLYSQITDEQRESIKNRFRIHVKNSIKKDVLDWNIACDADYHFKLMIKRMEKMIERNKLSIENTRECVINNILEITE